jgi:dihydroorotase
MKIRISNGQVIDPARQSGRIEDVFIADGKIIARGNAPADFTAERTLDARGLIVIPGLIDIAARLREPGFEYRATLE